MFKSERMQRVTLVGPRDKLPEFVSTLHRAGVMHIVEHKQSEALDIGSPLGNSALLSELVVRVRGLLSLWKHRVADSPVTLPSYPELLDWCKQIQEQYLQIQEQRKHVLQQRILFSQEKEILGLLDELKLDTSLFSLTSVAFFFGRISPGWKQNFPLKQYEVALLEEKNKQVIGLIVSAEHTQNVSTHLLQYGFQSFERPKTRDLPEQLIQLERKLITLNMEEQQLITKGTPLLQRAEAVLREELKKSEAPLFFGATEYFFVLQGWVPEKSIAQLQKKLTNTCTIAFYHDRITGHEAEHAPVKLVNPPPVKSFESLLGMYSLPRYTELDPTFFMFLWFPVFFGFMLGDMGYAAVAFTLALLLKRTDLKQISPILYISALASFFFGVIFGEFFGAEIYHPLISREHDMLLLFGNEVHAVLVYALLLGLIHLNVGFILGFINRLHHGLKAAFFESGSWIILEIGLVLAVYGTYVGSPANLTLAGIVLAGIALLMLVAGEGIKGLIEVPALFANVLSYARLMAIGLASVAMAVVINELATELFVHGGVLYFVVGIFILVTGHAINIALGIFGSFLHSLRLHYVEFFSKFYTGGGTAFKPFGVQKK